MMNIYQKILKDKLIDEDFISEKENKVQEFLSTGVINFNVHMSGRIDGAVPVGKMSCFSADSMLGKTLIGLALMADAQRKGKFAVALDGEYAWDWDLARKFGILTDEQHLLVYQNNQIEDVQSKIVSITNGLTKEQRAQIFFMLDSWGSLVTLDTVKKAQDPESKKDMTIPIKKNNLANLILWTQSTFYVINGVYDNTGGFGDPLKIGGGKRLILNCQNVIQGRSRSKEEVTIKKEDVLTGSIIKCRVYKSRYSRELMEFEYRIKYSGGLDMFYGILDDAVDGGFVNKTETGYYHRPHIKNDKRRMEREIYTSEFWLPVFAETEFRDYLEKKYQFQGTMDNESNGFMKGIESGGVKADEVPAEEQVTE